MPIAHGEGCYYADEATLDALEAGGQVLFRYASADGRPAADGDDRANPNGSLRAIAGVINPAGNVAGLDAPSRARCRGRPGLDDGLAIIRSLVEAAAERQRRRRPDPGRVGGMTRRRRRPSVRRRSTAGWASPTTSSTRSGPASTGRPNDLELAIFSVMWSEHCSYKSSKPLLRTLPTAGAGVVAGPGENAGVISIGDGLAVAFKIESHNHPSAVEPYQGAATGVGGILRDIFTMGARPIAVLDALRFGDPADAADAPPLDGSSRGVGGYGNCVGVPTIGGELVFDPSYAGNPLVNVMAIGLLRASAAHPGRRPRPRQPRRSCSARRRVATGSAAPRSSPAPRSATTTRPSGRRSRSATRSPRSC